MRKVATAATQLNVSANLLTEAEVTMLTRMAPHDTDIGIEVWTAFLARILGRPGLRPEDARCLIEEYNTRRRL